jgi:DNA (cytosine-5)-methyltransferase 1
VVEQIKKRFYDLRTQDTLNTLFGVGCDGNYFIFVRFYKEKWHVQEPVEVNKHSAERFLWALFNLGTTGRLPMTCLSPLLKEESSRMDSASLGPSRSAINVASMPVLALRGKNVTIDHMAETPTIIDLFCGAGGMTLGFVRAGFEVAGAFDNWDCAVKTYSRNLGNHIRWAAISEDLELATATVILGGPPCQGFSSAGARRDDDHRNTLVAVFARLIAKQRPRAFVFENVEGFLTGGRGRFVFDLLDPLIEAGYRIHLRKVNAANFGVPQHRKRVVGIGGLGWDPTFPAPTHTARGAPGALLGGRRLPPTPSITDALAGLPPASIGTNGDDHTYCALKGLDLERARRLRPGQRMRDLPEELWHESYKRRAYRRVMDGTPVEKRGGAPAGLRRLCADEPSKAITGAAINEFIHPTEDRALTVRECARIQTFPDDFVFAGSRRDRAQQIGNAVPPHLAEVIARTLLRDLRTPNDGTKEGALLSFTPTLSAGMSPILDEVKRKVENRYGGRIEQGMLWV